MKSVNSISILSLTILPEHMASEALISVYNKILFCLAIRPWFIWYLIITLLLMREWQVCFNVHP